MNKKGWTSSRVSGPPRLSNKTPTRSSTLSGVVLAVRASAVTSALIGGKHFRSEKRGGDCDGEEKQVLERAAEEEVWEWEEKETTRGRSLWSEGMEEMV